MAAKKKTTKKDSDTKKKADTKKETTTKKKKTTKKSSKIKLSYQPVGFNSKQMTFDLKKKSLDGTISPLIEGLPLKLTVGVGEVIEVTQEQYDALVAAKCVESEEQHQERIDFIKNMGNQYPKTFSDAEVAYRKKQIISAHESQRMIYNDKLIRVD